MRIKKTLFNNTLPSHEQIFFGLLLTFVGGYFDSYSYINSNGIFANAQTGNLIFFGIEMSNKNYTGAFNYLPSIFSFVVGVIFNEFIISKSKFMSIRRYINISLLFQILLLLFVYLIPSINSFDIRPLIISFVCAMQFDSFRTIHNIPFASIFCTGNLRSASEHIFKYFILKNNASKVKIYIYLSLILFFLFGVIIGGILSNILGHSAILIVILVLILNLIFASFYDIKFKKYNN